MHSWKIVLGEIPGGSENGSFIIELIKALHEQSQVDDMGFCSCTFILPNEDEQDFYSG